MPKIERQKAPDQDPKKRIENFDEVNLGFDEKTALLEASRCLNCKNPTCIEGCPVNIDIRAFIQLIVEKKYLQAVAKIKETNALPAICGRVCPQENQCEKTCVLAKKFDPVAIGKLEKFVADYERKHILENPSLSSSKIAKKVAIIGSGPAGLTAGADLAKAGVDVTIFEAFHEAGGVLTFGIPEFRLPKEIVKWEIEQVKKLGVKIKTNYAIGKIFTIEDLFEQGFNAVFIGVGAGLPRFLGIPGEDLPGVYSANEFLTRINLMKAYKFPEVDTPIKLGKKVMVVGGGNVAMDTARSAKRLKAEVYLVYRRTYDEMPARIEEIEHAREEGIHFMLLTNPISINKNEANQIKSVTLQKMSLGDPDQSGRRSPRPIPNSEFELEIDSAVIAIGNQANPLLTKSTKGLELNKKGYIVIKDKNGLTSYKNVWAGGDIVTGSATVIEAMGAGKRASQAILESFKI